MKSSCWEKCGLDERFVALTNSGLSVCCPLGVVTSTSHARYD